MSVEATLRPRVGVVMVGDVAHVVINVVREIKMLCDNGRKLIMHVGQVIVRRNDTMVSPHHHGRRANLTLRNPTNVVFMEPLCDFGGLA